MKKIYILILFIVTTHSLLAQSGREVKGVVKDSTGNSVIAATVKLVTSSDTLMTRSDGDGAFAFRNVKSSQFTVTISSLGYRTLNKRFLFKDGTTPLVLEPIVLKIESNLLNTVVVNGTPAVTVKEDTVEYRASDFPVRENSVVEDVLKKLPGVEVDKDGNVTTQGKSVTRVRVNGKDFFNGDLKTATQQLPADIIEKIQVIDDYGDQANVSGIKGDREPEKILNIQIRPDRNKGYFGRTVVGAGNEDRYQLSGVGNIYDNDRQISAMANLNNNNANIFDFNGGNRGGNRGGGGGGGGGNRDGITTNTSAGLNYRDELSKKVSVFGSYSFSIRDNNSLTNSFVQTNNPRGTIFNTQNRSSDNENNNHRFNFTLEYKPDSLNYFRFAPSFNYGSSSSASSSSSNQTGLIWQDQLTNSNNSSSSPNIGGNILFNHRFRKAGRNLSMYASVNGTNNESDSDVDNNIRYYEDENVFTDSTLHRLIATDNKSLNLNGNVNYSEPISALSRIEFSYDYNYNKYDNSRITNVLDNFGASRQIDSLSNVYNYSFTTNRISLNYRLNHKNYNLSLGVTAQPTLLTGHSISRKVSTDRSNFNLIPLARFTYKFARTRELNIFYSGRSNEPSFNQIQPVRDVTNPQRPVVGNPDLNAAFNHSLNIRYNNSDPVKGSSLFTNLSGSFTKDRIVSNTVLIRDTLNSLKQETRYLNANGFYSINGFYSWSRSFSDRKYRVFLNGSANYNNNISYADNVKNIGKNWVFTQRVRMQINPFEWLEVFPAARYTFNSNNYSLESSIDRNVTTWSLDLDGRVYFLKTFNIGYDLSKDFNSGYTGSVATNPLIVNTYLEKQFLKDKSATLRLQGFDLLKQGTNINRTISDNSISDSQTNRLTQYFMLTFTMRLQKFSGVRSNGPMREGRGGWDGQRRRDF